VIKIVGKRKPILASGDIVADYEPLFKYWELAKKESRELAEKATLRHEDFEYLLKILSKRELISLMELLEKLETYMLSRVNAALAAKALKEVYNIEYELEDARRKLARILAGWLIEASNIWGDIRLKGPTYRT